MPIPTAHCRAVERHRARAGRDKHCVMTLLCTAARPGDPLREAGRELVLATDKDNDQVLFFQRAGDTAYNFPIELFQQEQVDNSDSGFPAGYVYIVKLCIHSKSRNGYVLTMYT